jgi:hypothetical protein
VASLVLPILVSRRSGSDQHSETQFCSGAARVPEVVRFEHELHDWLGDELLESWPCPIAAEALVADLRSHWLTGARLGQVHVTTAAPSWGRHPLRRDERAGPRARRHLGLGRGNLGPATPARALGARANASASKDARTQSVVLVRGLAGFSAVGDVWALR